MTREALARQHCASCHSFPEPALLDSATWKQVVLPQMRWHLGLYEGFGYPDRLFEQGAAGRRVEAAGVFPEEPRLSPETWKRLAQYYLENAPQEPPAPPLHPEIEVGLKQFDVHELSFRARPPTTSLVRIALPGLYVGDVKGGSSTLTILNRQLEVLDTVAVGSAPSTMHADRTGLRVVNIGRVPPTDDPGGRLIRLFRQPGAAKYRFFATLIDSLQRPVCAAYADLSGNGREDAVVCEFGFRTGRLAWHENLGTGEGYESHTLREKPGALRVAIRDFNGNGRPDVMALFGQGDEGIYLYHNEGGGAFREERVLRFPPTYGSTSFRLADMNGDGAEDIIYTAGDNADYRPVMKGYHGVRVFLSDGESHFEEAYFYPVNGAYDALARDFDRDGDPDLAVISFFPDYKESPEESFVYLENQGHEGDALSFTPRTFEQSARGRWITLDAGDVDHDGDADLVLGSFSVLGMNSEYIPDRRQQQRMRSGPSVVLLENRAK